MSLRSKIRARRLALGVLMLAAVGLDAGATAQPVADFYRGKSITMLIGYRAQTLRRAFDETMTDPDFLAEAKERQLEVNPMSGAAIDKFVSELYETASDIVGATKAVIAEGAR